MKRYFTFFFCISFVNLMLAQDYIGSGNTDVIVTTSSNENASVGENVISGEGLVDHIYEAGRFLKQSTLAYDIDDIMDLSIDNDYEAWIDDQIDRPISYHTPYLDDIYDEAYALHLANGGNPNDYYGPYALHFNYAWWSAVNLGEDQLRQRVAFALSEILVISHVGTDIREFGEALSTYYDILVEHAFGNYRDLLFDVTTNPSMAYYLSSLNNPKTNGLIRPDENYAREVMQLFTIGLHMLNNDGSEILGGNGQPVPTYDNDDIKEFAKVFTGLYGGAGWDDDFDNDGTPGFGTGFYGISKRLPLTMSESQHEPGVKTLLNGETTNSDGFGDINNALDNLFNHQNVGPFIAKRLIQRLVKSNPTPSYISRVATVFNNNGFGERGDLEAVVKAILLDEEAREASWRLVANSGQFREPLVKFTNVVSAFDKNNESGNFWNSSYGFLNDVGQGPLASPTVFNFFRPDYVPNNEVAPFEAPEFQLFNTRTAINWANYANNWTIYTTLFWDWEGENTENVYTDYTNYIMAASYPEKYINQLDILLTHGTMDDFTRAQIRATLNEFANNNYNRARMGLFLAIFSPEFNVLH